MGAFTAWGGCVIPAAAQLVSYDGFGEYGAGEQIESGGNGSVGTGANGGFGWGGGYDVSNAIKSLVRAEDRTAAPVVYANGEITMHGGERALRFYDVANGTYAVERPLGKVFEVAAGEDLWFSFLFRTNNGSPLANQDFLQVGFDDNANASSGNPRVSIGANVAATTFPPNQPYRFFARTTTSVANTAFDGSVDIAAGTTYLLVGHVFARAGVVDAVDLYVNPPTAALPALPSASIRVSAGVSSLSYLFIRTAGLENGDAYVVDELKVGLSYAAVVLPGPPPFVLGISEGAVAGRELRWSSHHHAVLETSGTLGAGTWMPVTIGMADEGSERVFALPADPSGSAYFRLRRLAP